MSQEATPQVGSLGLFGATEQVGKLIGFTTAALLVLSTSYDYSFLYALGLSFEDIPSNISDHIRSALVWAPRAAIYALVLVAYEMSMRIVEKGLPEEELIAQSSHPHFMRAFRKGPIVLFGVIVALMSVEHFFLSASSHTLYLGAIVIWGFTALGIVNHARMGQRFSTTGGRVFVILPIVVFWVGSLGYGSGERILNGRATRWSVVIKSDQGVSEKLELLGLRRFSTVAVVVGTDRNVSVIPNDSIVSARAIRDISADLPRICAWFQVACPPDEKSAKTSSQSLEPTSVGKHPSAAQLHR